MLREKDNYLSVSFELSKGLNFKWNFKDLYHYTTYFHHLFVIQSHNVSDILEFLTAYFRKLKSGDLMSVIYYDKPLDQPRLMKWIERSQLSSFDFSKLVKRLSSEPLTQEVKEQLTALVVESSQDESQHLVVNFLLEEKGHESEEALRRLVEVGRREGGLSYICSFFGRFKTNSVSFMEGINFLVYQPESCSSLLQFYNSHINSAAVKRAKVSLECTNGQLICYQNGAWQNVDFHKLQRTFYGPSIGYDQDEVHFQISENLLGHKFDLLVTLEITLFSQ
jgi:hypothetical protein